MGTKMQRVVIGLSESTNQTLSMLQTNSPKTILGGRIQPRGYARFGNYCDTGKAPAMEEIRISLGNMPKGMQLLNTPKAFPRGASVHEVAKEVRKRYGRILAKIKAIAALKKLVRARKQRLNPETYAVMTV